MSEPSIIDKLKNRCPDCKGDGKEFTGRGCPACHGSGHLYIQMQSDNRFWTVRVVWIDFRRWLSLKIKRLGDSASRKMWP